MSANKNYKENEAIQNYYKLKTEAVDRLSTADEGNFEKASDEEINKYQKKGLKNIPVWIRAVFIKFWFAGACCFFFYWGLGNYVNLNDLGLILPILIGFVMDILCKNLMLFLETSDKEYHPYLLLTSKKFYTLFANVLYAYLIFYLVVQTYQYLNIFLISINHLSSDSVPLSVEPLMFGVFYTVYDLIFVGIKDLIMNTKWYKDLVKKHNDNKKSK